MTARVAVVGLGRMGCRHITAVRSIPDCVLVAAVDPAGDQHRAAPDVPVLADISQLARHGVDYAVLASPTSTHLDLGAALAAAGIPTLIEKPLAGDLRSALRLQDTFQNTGTPAAVGYVERLQPAIAELHRIINGGLLGDIIEINTHRASAYPTRITDVGVIHDLATHDIDLASWLCQQPYTSISARTTHHAGGHHEDLFTAIGQLANGTLTSHRVNWLSAAPVRRMTVTTDRGCVTADTRHGTLSLHHNSARPPAGIPDNCITVEGVTRFAIDTADPLINEHRAFLDHLAGRPSPIADLNAGVRAVAVAETAGQSAHTGSTLGIPGRYRTSWELAAVGIPVEG